MLRSNKWNVYYVRSYTEAVVVYCCNGFCVTSYIVAVGARGRVVYARAYVRALSLCLWPIHAHVQILQIFQSDSGHGHFLWRKWGLCVCVCVCMRLCMCVHVFVCTCVFKPECVCLYVYMYVCIWECVGVGVSRCVYACSCVYVNLYSHSHQQSVYQLSW